MLNNFALYDMSKDIVNFVKFHGQDETFVKDLEEKVSKLSKYIKENK